MNESFDDKLRAFSEKHGAVLLGMHEEVQSMQKTVDKAEVQLTEAKRLSDQVTLKFENQQRDLLAQKTALTSEIRNTLNSHAASLKQQQAQAQALYEKALGLLSEHKERDLDLKRREAKVQKWMKRVELGILLCVLIALATLWYLVWKR